MEEEVQYCPPGTVPILFDLYEDLTTLSASGAQIVTMLRMRIVNVVGAREWETIGIPPDIDIGDQTDLGVYAIGMAKLELC